MELKCNSCGAIQSIVDSDICTYCGNKILIDKNQQVLSNNNTSETNNLIKMAEVALATHKIKDALKYYDKALELNIAEIDAWLGKSNILLKTNDFDDYFLDEVILYWENAIKYSDKPEIIKKRLVELIIEEVNNRSPELKKFDKWKIDYFYPLIINIQKIIDFAISIEVEEEKIKLYEMGFNIFNDLNDDLLKFRFGDILKIYLDYRDKCAENLNKLDPSKNLKLFDYTKTLDSIDYEVIDKKSERVNNIEFCKRGFILGFVFIAIYGLVIGISIGQSMGFGLGGGIIGWIVAASINSIRK